MLLTNIRYIPSVKPLAVGSHLILVVLAVEGDRESMLMTARYCSQRVSVDCPMADKRLRTSSDHLCEQLVNYNCDCSSYSSFVPHLVSIPDH